MDLSVVLLCDPVWMEGPVLSCCRTVLLESLFFPRAAVPAQALPHVAAVPLPFCKRLFKDLPDMHIFEDFLALLWWFCVHLSHVPVPLQLGFH